MPNAATSLVIGGFATGLGLATLVALPGAAPPDPAVALPEQAPLAPSSGTTLALNLQREARAITFAELDASARAPGEITAALRPKSAARD